MVNKKIERQPDRYFITGYKIAVKTGQYVFRLDQFDFKTLV